MSIDRTFVGRVVALQYRAIARKAGEKATFPVLRVHFESPDGGTDYHDLPNQHYVHSCPALQFMALHGWQPTALDDTYENIWHDAQVVRLTRDGRGGWVLHQNVLTGGVEALDAAEWFNPMGGSADNENDSGGADGGSGDSDGGGEDGVKFEGRDEGGVEVVVFGDE